MGQDSTSKNQPRFIHKRCGAFYSRTMRQVLLLISFFLLCQVTFGQVHWLINADSIPNCDFIKKGKFVNKETNETVTAGYSIVFKDGYATEFINDGEFYVKSKIEFLSDCKYQSTIIEVTIPHFSLGPGAIIQTEIIYTAMVDKLVEIKSTFNGNSSYLVLQRVE